MPYGINIVAAPVFATPADPTGTASSTGVMMGLAQSITPRGTGRVLAIVTGSMANDNAVFSGAVAGIRYGTGAAPANGAALTGTLVGGSPAVDSTVSMQRDAFAAHAVVTGLVPGTPYWFDLAIARVTGGTASASRLTFTLIEL